MRPLLAAILLLAAPPACRAQSLPDLRALTGEEMDSLAANVANNHIIRAGTVVAYGEIFEAPLLVGNDMEQILIDGVQVVPRPFVDANHRAQKIADLLHTQFYLAEKRKDPNASSDVEVRLDELKKDRAIDDEQVWKRHGKLAAFLVKVGGGQARVYMDNLPRPLIQKYEFIVNTLLRERLIKAESGGDEQASSWLRSRLEELKAAGKIDEFKWPSGSDVAKIRFPGENVFRDYRVGEDRSPFGLAYARRWKLRRKTTEAAVQKIADRLNAGGTLIYSVSFEKDAPADPAAVRALEAVAQRRDAGSNMKIARERLRLTEEQGRELLEELR